jgi:hypothetical protein
MIVREPNGEPKLLVVLAMAGLCEASRGTGSAFASELIPGGVPGREFRPSLSHPARTPSPPRPAPRVGRPEPRIAWGDGPICSGRSRP